MKILINVFLIVMFYLIDGEITSICEDIPLCNSGAPRTDGCGIIDSRGPEVAKVSVTKPSNIKNNSVICGKRNRDGIGYRGKRSIGHETEFGEFPWMVAIMKEVIIVEGDRRIKILSYLCGASLIHPEVVLTSAQCVEKQRRRLTIRAGEWATDASSELLPHHDREVIDIIIHPDYYEQGLFNDVALLILDSPLELRNNVQTVCLPSQNEVMDSSKCIATGWGKNSFEHNDKYHVILKKIELPIIQREACQERLRTFALGNYFVLHESFICAGGVSGIDMCSGDGGSPLVCPIPLKKDRYYQSGLVSWGIGCGNQLPAVYGNVAAFRNWIDNEMYKLNFDTSTYTV